MNESSQHRDHGIGVALITGAGSGIGRAVAERLAAAGTAVGVLDRGAEAAVAVVAGIEHSGGRALALGADVTSADELASAVAQLESAYGPITRLVCNAGLATNPVPFEQADPDEFDRVMNVNVKGVWLTCRAALPSMRRAGGGAIVVTGSIMGDRARPGFGAYAASKAAANHLARVLALELAEEGIRVNAVAPVATDTAMLGTFIGPGDQDLGRERFIAGIPLRRLATAEDVADAIAFLLSDEARFLTGIVVPVDGGRSI